MKQKKIGSNVDTTLWEVGSLLFFTLVAFSLFMGYPSLIQHLNPPIAESFDVPYPEHIQIIQLDPSNQPLHWVSIYYFDEEQQQNLFPDFIPIAEAETVNRRIIIQADRIMGASGTGGDFFNANATLKPCNPEPIANPQGAFGGLGTYPLNKRLVTQNQNTCTGYYHQNDIGQPSQIPPDVALYMDAFGWQARLISGQGGNGCNTDSIIGIPSTATGGTMTFQQAVNVSSPKFSTSTAGCTIFLPPSFPTAIGAGMGSVGVNFYRDLFLTGIYPNGDLLSDGLGMLHSVPALPWATRGVFSTVTMNQNWFFADMSVIPTNATNGLWQIKEHSKFPIGIMDDCQFDRLDDTFNIKTGTTDAEQGQCVIFKTFNSNELYFEDNFNTQGALGVFTPNRWDTSFPSKFDINLGTGKLDVFVSDTNDNAEGIRFNNGELIDEQAFVVQIPWTSATYVSGSSDHDLFYSMSSSTSFNRLSHVDAMSFSWTVESTGEKRFVTYLNDGSVSQDIDDGAVFLNATDQGSAMDSGCMEMIKDGRFKTWNFYTDTACTVLKDTLTRTTGEGIFPVGHRYPVFHYSDQINTGTGSITMEIDAIRIYNGQTEVPTSPFLPDIKVEGFVSGSGSNEMRAIVEVYDGKQDSTVLYSLPQGSQSTVFEGDFRENQLVFDLGDGLLNFSNHRMGVTEIDISSGVPVPFTLPISPHYPSGTGQFNEKPIGTFTVSVGLEDDSIDGTISMNITKITVGEHEYDFAKPDVTFWEQTIPALASSGCGGCQGTDTQPALPELDMGFVDANVTTVAPFVHGLDLPAPSGAITGLTATPIGSISLDWTHDGVNTTGYRIYRTSTETVDEVIEYTFSGTNSPQRISLSENPRDFGVESTWATAQFRDEIISRITVNKIDKESLANGGFVSAVIVLNTASPVGNDAVIANSTTTLDPASLPDQPINDGVSRTFKFTGENLVNLTTTNMPSATNVGFGIAWYDANGGSVTLQTRDRGDGSSPRALRFDAGVPQWAGIGGQDFLGTIASINQTRLSSPATPFVNDTGSLDTNFTDTTTIQGETYFYSVIALNGQIESQFVALINATEPSAPAIPSNLQVNFIPDNTEVRITWQEPQSDAPILNYTIFRDGIFLTNSTTESITDGIDTIFPRKDVALASFDYKVQAVNIAGAGTFTPEETADPFPDQVTMTMVDVVSGSQNDIVWVEPAGNGFAISGYKVERATTFTNVDSFENYTLSQPFNTELDSVGWVGFIKGDGLNPVSLVKNQFRVFDQNATEGTQALDFFINAQRLPTFFSTNVVSGIGIYELDTAITEFALNITGRHAFGGGGEDGRGGTNWVLVEWNLNNGTTLTKLMQTANAEEGITSCPVDDPFYPFFGYGECQTPATFQPAIKWSNGTLNAQTSAQADDFVINAGQGTLVLNELDFISLNVSDEFNTLFTNDDYATDVESWDLIIGVHAETSQTGQTKRNHIGGQFVVDEVVFTGGTPIPIWETLVADTGNTDTFFNDTAVTGTSIYRISALTSTGNGVASEQKGIFIVAIPSQVQNLIGSATGFGNIISWDEPTNAPSGYVIERAIGASAFSILIADTGNTMKTFTDSAVTDLVEYRYRVSGINAQGTGDPSLPVTIITLTIAPQVIDLGALASGSVIDLTWSQTADTTTGYEINRKVTGGSFITLTANTGNDNTFFNDPTVVAGVTYTYQVIALNIFGSSVPSNDAIATALNPPQMPTLSGVQNGNQIDLSWIPPTSANPITGYKIDRRINLGAFSTLVADTGTTLTTFSDSDVTAGNTFGYRIRALSISGESDASNVVDIVFGSHIIVAVKEQDGSGYKGGGSVKLVNSTFTQTKALNSGSNAVFDNLGVGNYNFTFIDLDNFILNKTFNFAFPSGNTTSTFDIFALVFDTDCPSSGGGTDVRIKMNYTDVQDISSYPSIPVCDSADKVSWSTTFTGDAGTANSQMIADFISAKFMTNADQFLVSAVPTATSYSEILNRILSIDIPITTASDTTINFDLFLGEAPPQGAGSPPSQGSGAGGGGSDVSIPSQKIIFQLRLTGLTLLSLTHGFLQPNDIIDGTVTVGWDGERVMRVSRINIGEDFTNLLRFDQKTPFNLDPDVDGTGATARSEATMGYKIFIPSAFCDEELGITQNCLEREIITIPVTFDFDFEGVLYQGGTEIVLDAREPVFDIVQAQIIVFALVAIFAVLFANQIRKRVGKGGRSRKQKVRTRQRIGSKKK